MDQTQNKPQDKHGLTRKFLVICISILTILPLAPLINRYIPPMIVGDWNLDLTISIILAAAVTWLILRLFHFFDHTGRGPAHSCTAL